MLEKPPKEKLSTGLLRILFQCVWAVRVLRPLVRRLWPAMQTEVGGHTYLLHPADNTTEKLMWRRRMRVEVASIGRLTLLVAGKRALVFDVGANCGAFALPLATAAGAGSTIVAFEPNPVIVERLRTNLALNGLTENVVVAEVALGKHDGEATLNLVDRNLGQSSLRTIKSAKSISVAVRPLVHYLPKQSRCYDIFVIKVDVEGFEDEVLAPFLSTTPSNCLPDAILVETHHDDSWSTDLRGILRQRGYDPFFDGEEGNTLFMRIGDGAKPSVRAHHVAEEKGLVNGI